MCNIIVFFVIFIYSNEFYIFIHVSTELEYIFMNLYFDFEQSIVLCFSLNSMTILLFINSNK